MSTRPPLSPRQTAILKHVVAEFIATGHPVGSKALVRSGAVVASPSTVRYELAELEALGLLSHPHTSAGRVPTDAGYRLYVEGLLEEPLGPASVAIDLSAVRNEIEEALRSTTEMLAQFTSLLALVTAPPLETTEIRHIEVLPLQPQVVMVVVITQTGGVTKKIFAFEAPVDAKLVEWSRAFLNEQLTGVRLGAHTMHQRLAEPGLSPRERGFLDVLRPAFTELVAGGETELYVGGAARLLDDLRLADVAAINDVMHVLEQRMTLLEVLRETLGSPRLLLRIGAENPVPQMRALSMVAANYGLATRNLGTVSLIGPTRMDYARAIRAVRGAAAALSDFVADVYER